VARQAEEKWEDWPQLYNFEVMSLQRGKVEPVHTLPGQTEEQTITNGSLVFFNDIKVLKELESVVWYDSIYRLTRNIVSISTCQPASAVSCPCPVTPAESNLTSASFILGGRQSLMAWKLNLPRSSRPGRSTFVESFFQGACRRIDSALPCVYILTRSWRLMDVIGSRIQK
jgi:hypothetical protein